ncbi:hypothetical protein HK44_028310 [Pseudomonas fluorescens HK44]|uniref:TIGR02285 family protein n=1 Tax=Pseudomonas fluorescens HK44 TaxID=1042209 RepID=A0A010S249_PSEFL|nr:TIGR02285 family protein [Pseudomonas fluorescens]EXF94834.1 hypothetical protein HK44_028310 [Pseudomonas fluorescens HK44]
MTRNKSHGCVPMGLSKLKGLSLIHQCVAQHLRLLGFGATLSCLLAIPSAAQAKDSLIWLMRDLPPLTIFDGPQKNQGVIDRLLPALIASMPEYQHTTFRVNRARGMQMLLEPSFTCDPSLLWSPERAKHITYSIVAYRVPANGIVIRHADREALAPFIIGNSVDLERLLADRDKKLGVIAERSYGQVVDRLLQQAPSNSLAAHYGNDALGSLLQMQRLGRLTALLGYWSEIRYQAQQQGISPDELEFYRLRGTDKYQSIHIACSDTEQGRQAITHINTLLRGPGQTRLVEFYAQWLDPKMRSEYLEDAKRFFQNETP